MHGKIIKHGTSTEVGLGEKIGQVFKIFFKLLVKCHIQFFRCHDRKTGVNAHRLTIER
ncbi:hypothetical protein D3C72_2398420 [compost metagenome]